MIRSSSSGLLLAVLLLLAAVIINNGSIQLVHAQTPTLTFTSIPASESPTPLPSLPSLSVCTFTPSSPPSASYVLTYPSGNNRFQRILLTDSLVFASLDLAIIAFSRSTGDTLSVYSNFTTPIYCMAAQLALDQLFVCHGSSVQRLSISTGQLVTQYPLPNTAWSLVIIPSMQSFVVAYAGTAVRHYSIPNGNMLGQFTFNSSVFHLDYANGILYGRETSQARVKAINITSNLPIGTVLTAGIGTGPLHVLNEVIYTVSTNVFMKTFLNGTVAATWPVPNSPIYDFTVTDSLVFFALSSPTYSIAVYNHTGSLVYVMNAAHAAPIYAVLMDQVSQTLVSAGLDAAVRFWCHLPPVPTNATRSPTHNLTSNIMSVSPVQSAWRIGTNVTIQLMNPISNTSSVSIQFYPSNYVPITSVMYAAPNDTQSSFVADAQSVFIATGPTGDSPRLIEISRSDISQLITYPTSNFVYGLALDSSSVYGITGAGDTIVRWSRTDQSVIRTFPTTSPIVSFDVSNGILYQISNIVTIFDTLTGDQMGSAFMFPGATYRKVVASGGSSGNGQDAFILITRADQQDSIEWIRESAPYRTITLGTPISDIAVHGEYLYIARWTNTSVRYDLGSERVNVTYEDMGGVWAIASDSVSTYGIQQGTDAIIHWSATTGRVVSVTAPSRAVPVASMKMAGSLVLVSYLDGTVEEFSVPTFDRFPVPCKPMTVLGAQVVCSLLSGIYPRPYGIQVQADRVTYKRNAPVISAVSNLPFDVAGNELVQISAQYIGNTTTVLIDEAQCTLTSNYSGGVQCYTPAGLGAGKVLVVYSDGFMSEPYAVSYRAPVITGVTPFRFLGYDTRLTILGNQFGSTASTVQVWFNDFSGGRIAGVNPTWVSSNSITVSRNPAMTARLYYVSVVVGGQESLETTITFSNLFSNTPPVAYSLNVITSEDSPVLLALNATDADEQPLTYSIVTLPKFGALKQYTTGISAIGADIGLNGIVTDTLYRLFYVPRQYYNGQDSFRYSVSDTYNTTLASVSIVVTSVNNAPSFKTSSATLIVSSSKDAQLLVLDIIDVDETKEFTLYAVDGKAPRRGKWSLANSQQQIDFKGTKLPFATQYQLAFTHDGFGGGFPFTSMTLEIKDSENAVSSNQMEVVVTVQCEPGFVNNVWGSGDLCKKCPDGGICSNTGSFMPINALGYFPLSNGTFIACTPADACPEGLAQNGTLACAAGYSGLRCGLCQPEYYRFGVACAKCPENKISLPIMVVIGLAALTVILVIANILRKIDLGFIGILITYFQTIAIFQSFRLKWPTLITDLFKLVSIFNLNIELTSPECYLAEDNSQSYEYKYFATLAAPAALTAGVLVVILLHKIYTRIAACFKPQKGALKSKEPETAAQDPNIKASHVMSEVEPGMEELANKMASKWSIPVAKMDILEEDDGENQSVTAALLAALLFALKLLYLTLSRRAFEIFNCVQDDSGIWYFEIEPSRKCYSEDWWWSLFPYAVASIVVYVIGIPAVSLYVAIRRIKILKKRPYERNDREKFMLQLTYKKQREFRVGCDYWDVMIMTRKLLIVASQLFFTGYTGFQAVLLLLVLFVSQLLHKDVMPYTISSLNFLESSILSSSVLVLLGGLLFYLAEFPSLYMEILAFLIVIIVTVSTFMVLMMLVKHFRESYVEYKNLKIRETMEATTEAAKGSLIPQ